MPQELRHLADKVLCRRTHEEMLEAAETAESWLLRERKRVADAKRRGVTRIIRRGDDDPSADVGFYGKSILFDLDYLDFARCLRTDLFHHVAGEVKAIFTLVLNRGGSFSQAKRDFCSEVQGKLAYLIPSEEVVNDNGDTVVTRIKPRWIASKQRIALVDELIYRLKWYEGAGSRMKSVNKGFADNSGHDWHLLASDAGVYLLKMYRLNRHITTILCSMLRVCENTVLRDVEFCDLPEMEAEAVRTFAMGEMYLPLDFCGRYVHHKIMHPFSPGGHIADCGGGTPSWMYPEERMMCRFKRYFHSNKNRYVSMAKMYTLLQMVTLLRAERQPEDFGIGNPGMSTLQFMTQNTEEIICPDWFTQQRTIELTSKAVVVSLTLSERRGLSKFMYSNIHDNDEFNNLRELYEREVSTRTRKHKTMMDWAEDNEELSPEQQLMCEVPEEIESYEEMLVCGLKFRSETAECGLTTCNSGVKLTYYDQKYDKYTNYYGIIQAFYSLPIGSHHNEFVVKAFWMHDLDHQIHDNRESFLRRVTKGNVSRHTSEPYALVESIVPTNVLYWPREIP